MGLGRKYYLGPAEIASFSRQDFRRSMIHSDMLYRLDISTFYFYAPLLFQIFVPCLLSLLQSTTTQIAIPVNIFICFKYYSTKSVFLVKHTLRFWPRFFYIQIWFKCETPLLFFLIRTMVYKKKLFIEKNSFTVDYVKIIELHTVHTWRHMKFE